MKNLSFKVRLLLSFWAVVVVGLCLPALVFHQQLHQTITEDAGRRVMHDLTFIRWSLEQHDPLAGAEALDHWCKDVSKQLGFRITYIAEGGKVIADSHVSADRIADMDNHWRRPEVMQAVATGEGVSVRTSDTIHRSLIYAAVPVPGRGALPAGVLRVAAPASTVNTRLNQLMTRFWAITLVTLLATGLISYALSSRFEAPIQHLIEAARAIGRGDYPPPFTIDASPELERLSRTINDMAARIQEQMDGLDAQKSRLETILDSMKEGVLLLDREGRIDRTNRFLRQIQSDPKPRTGLKLLEVFLSAELQQACDRIIAGGDGEYLELRLGENRFYDVSMSAVRTVGRLDGIVVVLHDVSEFKRLERVRRDFVANVSHELRTPLTAITGYAETLLETDCAKNEEVTGFITTILKKAAHMTRMVNDLLLLTHVEHHSLGPPTVAIDAVAALEAAMETCQPMAREKEIEICSEVGLSHAEVLAERDGLIQVFQNLLANAIRYSPPRTTVTIGCEDHGEQIELYVRDQGPGIARMHQNRIFERFYRVDKQRESISGSTGLGLAICRHIVENFGGRIWVQSPPPGTEQGSMFSFVLNKGIV